jgi:RNA polymerase sigma factor (sigma-70 family)
MPSQVNGFIANPGVIGLDALSGRQRRFVEGHLPLVYITIERMDSLVKRRRVGREYRDFVQEGCLALADSVRCHDPKRHGRFAPYAMARIHFAISRFAHEHASAVRVPYIEQRRRASRRSNDNRHDPGEPPRTFRWRDSLETHKAHMAPDSMAHGSREDVSKNEAISEALRTRCRRAMSDAMDVLSETRRAASDLDRLIDECYQHRWSIPEPTERTSMRDLATQCGCSPARISRLEEAFYRETAAAFETDSFAGVNQSRARKEAPRGARSE